MRNVEPGMWNASRRTAPRRIPDSSIPNSQFQIAARLLRLYTLYGALRLCCRGQDLISSAVDQLCGDACAERGGVRSCSVPAAADRFAAVERDDGGQHF